jgi:hypothetical protein
MKNSIIHFVFRALIFVSALLICACSELADEIPGGPLPNSLITPTGGVFTAYDGTVILTFPEGAISSPVEFTVNMCMDMQECNFMLRPIKIEPLMLFNQPVNVTLRYDGMLAISENEITENICLMASLWKSETDYENNAACSTCLCAIDYALKTISFCICNSGIITIGLPE